MKKISTLILFVSFVLSCFGSTKSLIVPVKKATEIWIPVGKNGQKITFMELTQIKVKDYEVLTGQKFSFADKIGFKIAQRELRKSLNADLTINSKRLENLTTKLQHKADTDKKHGYLRLTLIFLLAAVVLSIIGLFVPFVWILASIAYLGAAIFFILWLITVA